MPQTQAPSVPATYYEEGSIVIDMVDPATRRLLRRGAARTVVTSNDDGEARRQRLNEVIARILGQYPPR